MRLTRRSRTGFSCRVQTCHDPSAPELFHVLGWLKGGDNEPVVRPMAQVGIVVRDIDKAMRHWVEVCGVGPWFYAEQLPMDEFRYKGRPYDIKVSIALANSGDVQLELIQQRCDSPSLYRDFLAAGHEGMQHWSSWPVNYHEIRERALKTGWRIGQEGDTPRGPFIYFLNEGHPGTVVEMAEATPTRMRIFDQVREAALGWDGKDAIRMDWPQA